MFRVLVLLGALAWGGAVFAGDQPTYGPPDNWVVDAPIPAAPPADGAPAAQLLLHDDQVMADAKGDHWYHRAVYKVLGTGALAQVGTRTITWDPAHDTLVIHHLLIHRGDQVIDALAGGKTFLVLRRETNLERAMLDGALTATKQIEGLQVGDIMDYAYTITSHDAVLQDHTQWNFDLRHQGVAGRVRIRAIWGKDKPIRWRETEGMPAAVVTHEGGGSTLVIDASDVVAPKAPTDAPGRFDQLGELQMTQYADWSEVSALMAPLYANAERLAPTSPIRAEADKIKAASNDPKTRAALALALVEDQIRYLALSMNDGGYVPADIDDTWSRRFGDCKGKTVLLVALLRELGIEADPALVSTTSGDGMDQRLPMQMFDHVIVRAVIGGKVYWLDGTRQGDHQGIDALQTPPYRWALPVRSSGAALEQLVQVPASEPQITMMLKLDASAGLDVPAPAHMEIALRGDMALQVNLGSRSRSREDMERTLNLAWTQAYPWLAITKTDWSFDDAKGVFRITMDGTATMDWRRNRDVGAREYRLEDFTEAMVTKRPPGPGQDAPYAVVFPFYVTAGERIVLPGGGGGFSTVGSDVDLRVAGYQLHRALHIDKGVVVFDTSTSSPAPEFPASEADALNKNARDLADDPPAVRAPKG